MRRLPKTGILAAACICAAFTAAALAGGGELGALERAFQKAASKVADAVVAIECDRKETAAKKTPARRTTPRRRSPFRPRVPMGMPDYRKRPDAAVSGVIVDENFVLTTAFNMAGNVSNIKVTLSDGRRYDATYLAKDETRDIALLKIETHDRLPSVKVVKRSRPGLGQFVVVVGRSESVPNHSLTSGIVSATRRSKDKVVQIDAKLNYGNAGGAVVDVEGNFLGIASGVSTKYMYGVNSGVGFFTPADGLVVALKDLKKGKDIKRPPQPFLGVQANQATQAKEARIEQVYPNTAAAEAGMKPGDVVTEFNGEKVGNWFDLVREIQKTKPGDKFTCKVQRRKDGGGFETVALEGEIGERPLGR